MKLKSNDAMIFDKIRLLIEKEEADIFESDPYDGDYIGSDHDTASIAWNINNFNFENHYYFH